jgi:hypothetical protein
MVYELPMTRFQIVTDTATESWRGRQRGDTYPEPLGEDGGGDLLVLGHLGEKLVVGGLVEQHRVVHLLLLLPLAPLLLLLLASAGLGRLRGRRRGLVLLRRHGRRPGWFRVPAKWRWRRRQTGGEAFGSGTLDGTRLYIGRGESFAAVGS